MVENVCGAQPWVGRAKWHYGSFYLWGDVPALMPITMKRVAKVPGIDFNGYGQPGYKAVAFNGTAEQRLRATKNTGGSWFGVAHNTTSGKGQNPDGRLRHDPRDSGVNCGGDWFGASSSSQMRRHSSKSAARRRASAHIAKIPLELATHIARAWKPA